MTRPLQILLTFLLASASLSAQQEKPDLEWKPLAEKPRAHKALVDCRSPVIPVEKKLKLDETWTLDAATLTFEQTRTRFCIIVKRGDAGKPKTFHFKNARAGLVTLRAFGTDYGLSARLDPDGKHVRIASAWGLAVPLGRDIGYLVDSDMDGKLGGDADGVVAPNSRTVGPMTNPAEIWSEHEAVTVKRNDDGTWSVAPLPMPKPENPDHSGAWRLLMSQRQTCGLLPLAYHPELEKGMRLHAEYLRRNKRMGHGETEGRAGFTEEGRAAGLTSVIGYSKKSYREAMREQLLTLFHRSSCLAPDLRGSALVLHRGIFLASTTRFVGGPLRGRILVYPPHGMRNVPCEFSSGGEMPMPVAGKPFPNRLGTPVGVFCMGFYRTSSLPEKPTFKLLLLGRRGSTRKVDGKFYYPGNIPKGRDVGKNYRGSVAFIPTRFLKPNTTYRASISIPVPVRRRAATPDEFRTFSYQWQFKTTKRARK